MNKIKLEKSDLLIEKERLEKDNEYLREILREGQKEYDELQERIDKAIEYIDNSDILDIHHKNRHDLLEILKGSDKE